MAFLSQAPHLGSLLLPHDAFQEHAAHVVEWSTTLVGRIRARYLTARLPNPPVRPVRETFASYGSRERDVYRKLPFRQLHGTFTVVSLRVRWLPLYHFPTLSLRAFAMCAVFPRSDYYAPFDCLEGLGGFGSGLPYLLPPSFTSLAGSPVFTTEDSNKMV